MRNWVQFTKLQTTKYCSDTNKYIKLDKPIHKPALGSFANIKFDGRYNLDTLIHLSIDYLNRNSKFNYSGFIIHNGEWLKENKVYQYKAN